MTLQSSRRRRAARPSPSLSPRWTFVVALAAILFLALNLRIPTTALGPLVPDIQATTGHGETFISLLTTIPLALTLAVAPFAPRIAARFGRNRVIGGALVGILLGTALRSLPGDPTLLAGTVILGCSIALGTVLVPAAIAAEPVRRRGALTGVYTMALSLGPALALGLTIPIMHATGSGWRMSLALWSVCGVVALLLWIAHTRASRSGRNPGPRGPAESTSGTRSTNAGAAPDDDAGPDAAGRPALTDPNVWVLAVYLGVTSLTFYTTSAWLPTTFMMDGLAASTAGGYASLLNVVALPFAFLAPIGMRRGFARILAPVSPLIAVAAVGLLLAADAAAALPVAILFGVAQGLCLGVSYAQIVQYATSAKHAASVSAVTSAVGIAIAALGPLVFGFGLETAGSYVIPMYGLGAIILIQVVAGLRASRCSSPGGRRRAGSPHRSSQ